MTAIINILNFAYNILDKFKSLDFIAPLLLRIYLAPIFIKAGYGKLQFSNPDAGFLQMFLADPNVVAWFGGSLGMPFPELMAFMAGWTEFLGGWFLVFGIFTRFISVPLIFTMIIAATAVHWDHGWHTLPEGKLTVPWEWRVDLIEDGLKRRDRAVLILKEHGNYEWLTEAGNFTVAKNGIEFAATYFIMLLVLFFVGAGRFLSIDYWLGLKFRNT